MTLFIDIEHPERAEPLCLMCGSGFEVLRTDATGVEVYGKSYRGKDYLLFPLDFSPVDAGVLAVGVPSEYQEWFMERGMDGARVVFSTPHGAPFFSDMPEEFHSSAGYLRVKDAAAIHIELDRLEPGATAQETCACGHEHAAAAEHCTARACGHEAHGGQAAHGGHEARSDRELAGRIRDAAKELNVLLDIAAREGLLVRLALGEDDASPEAVGRRLHVAGIFRPL